MMGYWVCSLYIVHETNLCTEFSSQRCPSGVWSATPADEAESGYLYHVAVIWIQKTTVESDMQILLMQNWQ